MTREQLLPDSSSPIILTATDIHKSFGGVRALNGVSLALAAGEIHGVIGENGAGKSTLTKILTGALQPDSGELHLGGRLLPNLSPGQAKALGIAAIYQQPALFPQLSVAENIALGRGAARPWKRINWKQLRKHAADILETVGARISPNTLAGNLSMPEQQLVEIARAIDADSSVLIVDEPTASLGDADAENLFRVLCERRAQGTAIVYITHRLEELFRLADRVTVLRDGESVSTVTLQTTSREQLIRLMIGRELTAVFPARSSTPSDVMLSVRGISSAVRRVNDVSFDLRRGEILGLAGLVGSGRTELAELLFGLTPMDNGEVYLQGRRLNLSSPRAALREGLAYLPEDRRNHGVVLPMSVAANTTLASLPDISTRGFISDQSEMAAADKFIRSFAVKTPSTRTVVGDLSGGNQQKVALARWLMTAPKVLILDEPTQGIDIGAKAEIYELISQLAQSGMAILMISSDMNEVLGMSDRIAVMTKGRLVRVLPRAAATPYAILQLSLGHEPEPADGKLE